MPYKYVTKRTMHIVWLMAIQYQVISLMVFSGFYAPTREGETN